MPNRWPISSGNWSDAAIWSGSIIPTASDDVFANSQSIYIDTDITVLTLRNSSTTGVTQGGIFYINNGVNINLTANPAMYHTGPAVFAVTNTPLVIISGSNTAAITGSLEATTYGPKIHLQDNSSLRISGSVVSTTNTANVGIRHSSAGNLTITGSIAASSGQSSHAIYLDNSGSLNVLGNVTAGAVVGANGIFNIGTGNITVTGNVSGSSSTGHGINNTSTGNITIIGNTISGGGNPSHGINNSGNGNVIRIVGNVLGGGGVSTTGLTNSGVGTTIIITGSVGARTTAGTGNGLSNTAISTIIVSGSVASSNANGTLSSNANGTLIIYGPISSSVLANGVSSTGTGATNLFTGPFYNTGSYNAVFAYRMQMLSTSSQWTFDTETAGVIKTLYTSNQLPGVSRENNVRKGTTYNFGLTGSLAMPDPSTVKTGVAVDNTTGSAILTAEDMFNVATQTLTTSGSIGNLLTGASTVQTVGATISSFKV